MLRERHSTCVIVPISLTMNTIFRDITVKVYFNGPKKIKREEEFFVEYGAVKHRLGAPMPEIVPKTMG